MFVEFHEFRAIHVRADQIHDMTQGWFEQIRSKIDKKSININLVMVFCPMEIIPKLQLGNLQLVHKVQLKY